MEYLSISSLFNCSVLLFLNEKEEIASSDLMLLTLVQLEKRSIVINTTLLTNNFVCFFINLILFELKLLNKTANY
jgi:hypothetical protein